MLLDYIKSYQKVLYIFINGNIENALRLLELKNVSNLLEVHFENSPEDESFVLNRRY